MRLKELFVPRRSWADIEVDTGEGLFSRTGPVARVTQWQPVVFLAAVSTLTCAVASQHGEAAVRMLAGNKLGIDPATIDAEVVEALTPEFIGGLGDQVMRHVGDIIVGADRLFWDPEDLALVALRRITGVHQPLTDVQQGENGPVEVRALDPDDPELWETVFGWFLYWLGFWGTKYGCLRLGAEQAFYAEVMQYASALRLEGLPGSFRELDAFLHARLNQPASPLAAVAITAMFQVPVESPYFGPQGWQSVVVPHLPAEGLKATFGELVQRHDTLVSTDGIISAGRAQMAHRLEGDFTPRAERFGLTTA